MRTTVLAFVTTLALPIAAGAQAPTSKSATIEAQRANLHYQQGWEAMRAERWAEAAAAFQQAIENDPKFALAYYSLGRAQMGLRNFPKAIAAYLQCRELYETAGGERFANDLDAKRRIEDRILEYQVALRDAQQAGGVKSGTQSQQLYIRELQMKLIQLQQARDQKINLSVDASVPFFVPMALGAAYFRNNQFADAEREYKAAIEANSASGETHNNLAVLYLMTDRPEQAEREIKLAEGTGFKVNPALKEDVRKRKSGP